MVEGEPAKVQLGCVRKLLLMQARQGSDSMCIGHGVLLQVPAHAVSPCACLPGLQGAHTRFRMVISTFYTRDPKCVQLAIDKYKSNNAGRPLPDAKLSCHCCLWHMQGKVHALSSAGPT